MIWAVGFIPSAWLWDQDRCDRVGFLQGVSRAAWRTVGQQRAIDHHQVHGGLGGRIECKNSKRCCCRRRRRRRCCRCCSCRFGVTAAARGR